MLSLFKQMFRASPCRQEDSGVPTEPEEKQPDISKPVRELVAYILDRKNRGKVEVEEYYGCYRIAWRVSLPELGAGVTLSKDNYSIVCPKVSVSGWELTHDERVYIYKSLKARYEVVMGRLERYRKSIRNRKQQEERNRVTARLKELGYEE